MPSPPDRSQVPSFFATTRWTLVGDAVATDDNRAREGLAALFHIYWPPLYRYVRRCGRSAPDAEDLVQGFFTHLLEKKALCLADPDRGKFRAFLLGALKNYMANEWHREHALKRGGFTPHLSIDWQDAETGLGIELPDASTPDKIFDREWAVALLGKVLDDLAKEESDFARWKPFLGMSGERISYAEIAGKFGMTENAARVAVHRLRKRYRHRLQEEIARTLVSEEMVEEEMRSLFTALSGD